LRGKTPGAAANSQKPSRKPIVFIEEITFDCK